MYLFVTSGTRAPEHAGCMGSGSKSKCCLLLNKCQIRCLFGLCKAWTKTGKRRSQTSWHTHSEWIRWLAPEEQEKGHKEGSRRGGRTTCSWLQANNWVCLFCQRWFLLYSSASVTLSNLCSMLEGTPKGLWGFHLVLEDWERSLLMEDRYWEPTMPPEFRSLTHCEWVWDQTVLQEPFTLTRLGEMKRGKAIAYVRCWWGMVVRG